MVASTTDAYFCTKAGLQARSQEGEELIGCHKATMEAWNATPSFLRKDYALATDYTCELATDGTYTCKRNADPVQADKHLFTVQESALAGGMAGYRSMDCKTGKQSSNGHQCDTYMIKDGTGACYCGEYKEPRMVKDIASKGLTDAPCNDGSCYEVHTFSAPTSQGGDAGASGGSWNF